MAVSFRLVQRKHKKNKQGESPIYLRITQDRKSNYISTGVVVFPKQWNDEKERVRSSHPIADALNQRLSRLKIDAQEQIHLGKSAEEAKKELAGVGGDFVRFANERIRGFKDEGKVWQAKKLQTTLLKCQAVWGKQIAWSKITPKAIDELNSYMRTAKGNGVNTRRNDLQRVKRLFKHAIRQGEVNANDDPFIVYQMEKKQKTRKRKLSPQEIKMIEDVELSGFEAVARDTFLPSARHVAASLSTSSSCDRPVATFPSAIPELLVCAGRRGGSARRSVLPDSLDYAPGGIRQRMAGLPECPGFWVETRRTATAD